MDSVQKKYKIIKKIENDAPYGNINWFTISFVTPQKIEKINFLDVTGFKVHNGYNTYELSDKNAKEIKKGNEKHDVFTGEVGKLHSWDDATKTDIIEYDNDKLNEMERKRRENADELNLVSQQVKNEYNDIFNRYKDDRKEKARERIRKKLHERGIITKEDRDKLEEQENLKDKKTDAELETINKEIEEAFQTDYLDENPSTGLKLGIISIYSPKRYHGLKFVCFKVRGLFETPEKCQKRVKQLSKLYPDDPIYIFEVGKWCAFSESNNTNHSLLLKQLNYCMKIYLENLVHEAEEFEKRKNKMLSMAEQESKMKKADNEKDKKKEQRKERRSGNKNIPKKSKEDHIPSIGTKEDDRAIRDLYNFLNEPELKDRYPVDESKMETIKIDA